VRGCGGAGAAGAAFAPGRRCGWGEVWWLDRRELKLPPTMGASCRCPLRVVRAQFATSRTNLSPLSPSTFRLTSKLDAFLSFNALVFESVFDDFHFGDGVGEVDEGLGGVAAGDDGVLHVGAGL